MIFFQPIAMFCSKKRKVTEPAGHHTIQAVAMIISSVFYGFTIVAYILLPHLRNLQGLVVVSQAACLMLNFVFLSLLKLQVLDPRGKKMCVRIGIAAYYFFEASIVWLAVMSLDVYFALSGYSTGRVRRQVNFRLAVAYSLVGWGLPAILVITAVLIDNSDLPYYVLRPYFGVESCSMYYHQKIFAAYYFGPASIFITINIFIFLALTKKLYVSNRMTMQSSAKDQGKGKARTYAIIKLFFLMGISWIFEIISFAIGGNVYIWYLTDFFNIFLSIFIFCLFICKRKNLDALGLRYKAVGYIMRRYFSWEPAVCTSRTPSRPRRTVEGAHYSASGETVVLCSS